MNSIEKKREENLEWVQINGCALKWIDDQTPEICMAAVKHDGYALEYVTKWTYELCTEALKQNTDILEPLLNHLDKQINDHNDENLRTIRTKILADIDKGERYGKDNGKDR